MNWPWIARSSHLAILGERECRLAERDRRIAELEQERRMLWDMVCRLGLGAPAFSQPTAVKVEAAVPTATSKPSPPPPAPMPRRPSQVVARMTKQAFERWHRKIHPGREERKELVLQELDRAEMEVIRKQ